VSDQAAYSAVRCLFRAETKVREDFVAHYRTVFISDVHLGAIPCRADLLCDFLSRISTDKLVIVGDLIDYDVRRTPKFWRRAHTELLALIFKMARRGTTVVMIPGNHDDYLRQIEFVQAGNISIERTHVHRLLDGRRVFVTHGDLEEEPQPHTSEWAARAYDLACWANKPINIVRDFFGLPLRNILRPLKLKRQAFRTRLNRFQETLSAAAEANGCEAVVCGHIHHTDSRPAIWEGRLGAVEYWNCGDWTENMTMIVETQHGTLTPLDWRRKGG
jgi:UDP-2,3-diacylglucosamine pyrophosphatase LpxH